MAHYPSWAKEMAEIFKSGSISQFVLYGNIDDWVTFTENEEQNLQCLSLKDFLTRVMFAPFEVVLTYDRGHGIRTAKGSNLFFNFKKSSEKTSPSSVSALFKVKNRSHCFRFAMCMSRVNSTGDR